MWKYGGTLYIGVPPLQILGGRVPRPPKVYASAGKYHLLITMKVREDCYSFLFDYAD